MRGNSCVPAPVILTCPSGRVEPTCLQHHICSVHNTSIRAPAHCRPASMGHPIHPCGVGNGWVTWRRRQTWRRAEHLPSRLGLAYVCTCANQRTPFHPTHAHILHVRIGVSQPTADARISGCTPIAPHPVASVFSDVVRPKKSIFCTWGHIRPPHPG